MVILFSYIGRNLDLTLKTASNLIETDRLHSSKSKSPNSKCWVICFFSVADI